MKSPFPGMDPYLETHREDVHHRFIQYSCDCLRPHLPNDLRARVEERVFVETEQERIRHIAPDVHVSRAYPPPSARPVELREGSAAVAEPLVFELHGPEITEGYIEIRERGGGKVITVIEFPSLANKSAQQPVAVSGDALERNVRHGWMETNLVPRGKDFFDGARSEE